MGRYLPRLRLRRALYLVERTFRFPSNDRLRESVVKNEHELALERAVARRGSLAQLLRNIVRDLLDRQCYSHCRLVDPLWNQNGCHASDSLQVSAERGGFSSARLLRGHCRSK